MSRNIAAYTIEVRLYVFFILLRAINDFFVFVSYFQLLEIETNENECAFRFKKNANLSVNVDVIIIF